TAPGGNAGPATGGGAGPTVTTLAARGTRRAEVLRSGVKLTVRCSSGRLDLRAMLGKTVVARGRATCTGVEKRATLTLTKAGRTRLRAIRRPVLRVTAGTASLRLALR
ncbi:MAG: hypothetical protein J7513_11865, partial [Solirubrobacteraceae bacterium]|nr:hypothetical protein [Solirubrobacteraceae bacterium]